MKKRKVGGRGQEEESKKFHNQMDRWGERERERDRDRERERKRERQ